MSGPRRFRWEAVVKVGGSLGRRPRRLDPVLRDLAALARRAPILVVPGGGRLADVVRAERTRLHLSEPTAHAMALLSMDQYGLALADRETRARAVPTLAEARRAARDGRLPVLLAAGLVLRADHLERSFRLTSDAIALWLAQRVGARRLVLVKSVPGLDLRVESRSAARRAARRGLVDALVPRFFDRGLPVLILGPRPARRWAAGFAKTLRRGPRGRRKDASPGAARRGRPRTGRRARR